MGDQKKCKHCAMDIPKEALVCPHCRKRLRQSTTVRVVLGGLLLLFIIAMVRTSNDTSSPAVPIGGQGALIGTSGELTPVGVTEAALQEILTSFRVKDRDGMTQLLATGKAFAVPNGTKVLVVEHGSMFIRKIRVVEGTLKGRSGYVPHEWIRPL